MLGEDIGIDLGTSTILIYLKGKGIVLNEPSLIAIDKYNKKVIAIGKQAKDMLGKAPPNINIVKPLKNGVISDYNVTEIIIKHFISKSIEKANLRRPKIAISVPCEITSVQKKAFEDSAKDSGAREVFIIEEPVASAIGSGINIKEPFGNLIVDIGAGTTNIAVMSLGGVVISKSFKIAGDTLDQDIINYIRKKYNIIIGDKTAEKIKIEVGTAFRGNKTSSISVRGQNIITALPGVIEISSSEVYDAIRETINSIIKGIKIVLEKTPPELCSDIYERGINLSGGGVMLDGLSKAISEQIGIKANVVENPITCVALGTGESINLIIKEKRILKQKKKFLSSLFSTN